MATKKPKKTRRKINHKLKARNAAIRQIAKEEGLSFTDAKMFYPDAIIDVIWTRPGERLSKRFFEVSPHKFLQIEPGKKAKLENTFGRIYKTSEVSRIRKLQNYWATIRILSEERGVSINEARSEYTRAARETPADERYPELIRVWFDQQTKRGKARKTIHVRTGKKGKRKK